MGEKKLSPQDSICNTALLQKGRESKRELREFIASRRVLEEMVKGELWAEVKGHWTVSQSHITKEETLIKVIT